MSNKLLDCICNTAYAGIAIAAIGWMLSSIFPGKKFGDVIQGIGLSIALVAGTIVWVRYLIITRRKKSDYY